MNRLVVAFMVVVGAACGGDDDSTADPAAACEQYADVLCAKLFECTTEAEREAIPNFPATEAACVSEQKEELGCAEQTLENVCDSNETYDPAAAAECLDQLDALECGNVRDGVDEDEIPACEEVCVVE